MTSPVTTGSASTSTKKNENFVATRIFINQVPEYDLMPYCAEREVSTIVRNMANGCGDGSRTTSYACFCYESSTHFSSLIGNHVSTACDDGSEQATQAVDVFSKYCQIGLTRGLGSATAASVPESATSSDSSTLITSSFVSSSTPSGLAVDTASPSDSRAAVVQTSDPSSTASSNSSTSNSSGSSTNGATIAAAVIVPIVVISLLVGAFLFFRARKRQSQSASAAAGPNIDWKDERGHSVPSTRDGQRDVVELATREKGSYYVAELPVQKNRFSVAELDTQRGPYHVAELPGHGYR